MGLYSKLQRLLIILSILCLGISTGIHFLSQQSSSFEDDQTKIVSYIEQTESEIQSRFSSHLGPLEEPELIELPGIQHILNDVDDFTSLRIYKDKKLLFWKGETSANGWNRSYDKDSYLWEFHFNLFENKQLSKFLIEECGLNWHYEKVSSQALGAYKLYDDVWLKPLRKAHKSMHTLGVCLVLISFLLLMMWIHRMKQNYVVKISLSILCFIAFYLINAWFQDAPSIINDRSVELSFMLPSLLDMFFFSVTIIAISIDLEYWYKQEQADKKEGIVHLVVYGLLNAVMFTLFINEFQTLIYNENLSFNFQELSNISFVEIASMMCLASWNIALFINTQLFIKTSQLFEAKWKYIAMAVVITLTCFAAYQFVELRPVWILPIFLIIYFLLHDLYYDAVLRSLTWLILWIIVYSAFTSILLFHFDTSKAVKDRMTFIQNQYSLFSENQFEYAQRFVSDTLIKDVLEKYQLHPSIGRINKQDILQFIDSKYIESPTSEVELILYGTDSLGKSIFSEKTSSIKLDELFLINRRVDSSWSFLPLQNTYLKQTKFLKNHKEYTSYIGVKYKETKHLNNDYQYSLKFQDSIYFNGAEILKEQWKKYYHSTGGLNVIYEGADAYIYYQPAKDTQLITKKGFSSIVKPISLFSLFFCLFVLLVIFLFGIDRINGFLPQSLRFEADQMNSLSIRIQVIIIGIIVLSFVSIVLITSWYLGREIRQSEDSFLQDKIAALNLNFQEKTNGQIAADEALQILLASKQTLENIHNLNLNFYDQYGRLLDEESSSYTSDKIQLPFIAYHHLKTKNQRTPITINNNNRNTYFPILYKDALAFASLELNQTQVSSRMRIFDFLGTLLNVYVFLFLIAGAIAIAMARSITEPISTLALRMKQIKLGKENQSLEWQRNDELGLLINNYNDMLLELEKSAKLLAKTERDGAWREMAKQVAHEIKNPLTPMKLSIQYLSRAIKAQPENSQELVQKISNTLIEQIDNLSGIANSFANFGELPKATNEKVVLNEVIETIHDLFRKREDIDVKMNVPLNDLTVFADKTHLIRVLNNLVKNAIQAIPNDRNGWVNIELYRQGSDAIIQVSDNGVGIRDDMKEKIFRPNFTTKTSGSGLGLAIATNMLESFNAKLDFDSVAGTGSNFYITVPLMKFNENFNDETEDFTIN